MNIHIGIVLQCKKKDCFGIVLGYARSTYSGDTMTKMGFPIISYFEKESDFSLQENSFVAYLLKKNDCNQAFGIIELSSFKLVGDYFQEEMQSLLPFVQISAGFKCLYYPVNNKEEQKYLECVLSAEMGELFNCFLELKEIKQGDFPSDKDSTSKFMEIYSYVSNFDIDKELQTYKVVESAWYKSRLGRDDQYFMEEVRSIESSDSYIRSLLPLCHDLRYYTCNGRSADEVDFSKQNLEQTNEDKNNAIKKYSRQAHIHHLINEYYEFFFIEKNKKDMIWTKIKSILEYYHVQKYCGCYFYGTQIVKHFNNMRQCINNK